MKKSLIIIFFGLIFLYGCVDEKVTISKEDSEILARNLVESSDEYRSGGFDITLDSSDTLYSECVNCYSFEYQFGVLGDRIGYKMTVEVRDGVAEFVDGPNSIG